MSVQRERSGSSTAVNRTRATDDKPLRVPRDIHALKDGRQGTFPGRSIIVCLDGTGDKFDADNSNIIHLVSCLKKSDRSQVNYYQSGIGTYDGGGLSNGMNAALDMAVGSGLGEHIRDAYRFLMQNYRENDRISLFGFSRGAYTARCLAGMVHKVGLLPAHNVSQVAFAYQFYKDDTPEGWKMSGEFKRTFCMDVSVHFIGVFDSVSSVGFIPRTLPLSSTPCNKPTYFRHAMALDEHRSKFKVCRFQTKDHASSDSRWETMAEIHEAALSGHPAAKFSPELGAEDVEAEDPIARRKRLESQAKKTDVLEVWFAGAHADVGGGAVKNEERHKLAQIPLRWMIRQCFECDTGIIFDTHRLAQEGLDVHTLWPVYTPLEKPALGPIQGMREKFEKRVIAPISRRSTVLKPVDETDPEGLHHVHIWKDKQKLEHHENWVPEQVEDYFDCISPINDELAISWAWWVLEAWPVQYHIQNKESGQWQEKTGMNLGRHRGVQDALPNLHWTVQQRMEAIDYQAKVRLDRHAEWNVVV